jgi:hypothetical protein
VKTKKPSCNPRHLREFPSVGGSTLLPTMGDGGRDLSVARRATAGNDQIRLGEWFAPLARQTPQQVLIREIDPQCFAPSLCPC